MIIANRKYSYSIILLLYLALLLVRCSQKEKIKFFNLKIVMFENYNTSPKEKFPIEIQNLCKSFENSSKFSIKCLPIKIEIIRLGDNIITEREVMDLSKDNNSGSLKYREYKINKFFDTANIGNYFTRINISVANPESTLINYLNNYTSGKNQTYIYTKNKLAANLTIKSINNHDSLIMSVYRDLIISDISNITVLISPNGDLIKNISSQGLFSSIKESNKELIDDFNPISDEPKTRKPKNEDTITKVSITNKVDTTKTKVEDDKVKIYVKPIFRVSLNKNKISWTDMGMDYEYELNIKNRPGEGIPYLFNRKVKENNIDVKIFDITDTRIYIISINAKKGNQVEMKTISFNLIKNGTEIDPRCKNK